MSQTPAAQSGGNRFVRGIEYLTEIYFDFNKKPELRRKLKKLKRPCKVLHCGLMNDIAGIKERTRTDPFLCRRVWGV